MSYESLADLARREEQLVADGQWPELALLQAERAQIIAALAGPAQPTDRPVLEEALRRSRATEEALGVELARVGTQLSAIRIGRRAVLGYGTGPHARLDTRA